MTMNKRIFRTAFKSFAVAIALISAIVLQKPVCAGTWRFTVTGSSTTPGFTTSSPSYSSPSPANGSLMTAYSSGGTINGSASATLTLNITGTWVPDPTLASDPAPLTQSFLETTSVTAQIGGTPGATSATANDGLGDSNTAIATPTSVAMPNAGGKHLSIGSNGTFSVQRTMTLSASAIPSGGGGFTMSYSIAPDTRMVLISYGHGVTYHKGSALTDGGTPQPVQNVRNSDGSLTDDSVLTDTFPMFNPDIDNDPNAGVYRFGDVSSITGNWDINSSFQWTTINPSGSFSGTLAGTYNDGTDQENITLFLNQNNATPSTQVTETVIDSLTGAVATGHHTIQWHQPLENVAKDNGPVEDAPAFVGSSSGETSAGLTANVTIPPTEIDFSFAEQGLGGILTVGGGVIALDPATSPLLLAFILGAGYYASLAQPPASTVEPCPGIESQFADDVTTEENILSGNTTNVFAPTVSRMNQSLADAANTMGVANVFNGFNGTVNFIVSEYRHKFHQMYTGDLYSLNGYTGQGEGRVDWQGAFQPVYNWTNN